MKTSIKYLTTPVLASLALITANSAHAEYYKWNGTAGATWDTSADNWLLYDGAPVTGTLWSSTPGVWGGNWAEFHSSGSATLSGDVYARGLDVKNSGTTFTINGNGLNYGYDTYIASGSTLALTGNVNFGGGITLLKGGTLQLSGNNSGWGDQVYWGTGGGVLELLSSTALQGNIGVWAADDANGQSVKLGNGSTISIGQTFRMMGQGVTGDGALFVNDGTTNTWGSSITLTQNSTIGVGSNGGKLNVSGPISGGNNLTVKAQGGGTVALSGNNTYTGTTTVTAGKLEIGNGGSTGSLGSGDVSLSVGTTLEFNRSNDSTVSNTITGDGGLTKSGNGLVSVTGNNTYTGTTRVSAGTLKIGDGGATGSVGSGDISVAAGAKLEFNRSGNTTVANNITSDEGITQINMTGGNTLTLTGNVKYGYESFVASGSTLVMTGNVDSWGGITLTGGGTLKLSGTSVGPGNSDMYLLSGILDVASSSAVKGGSDINQGYWGSASAIKLSGGTTAGINGRFLMGGTGPTGDGALFVNDGTANTWNSRVSLFGNSTIGVGSNGGQLTVSGVISGDNNLTVKAQGGGTVTLSGTNTYTGLTTVSEGTLAVNGSVAGAMTVASGATLQGSGTISGATTVSGNLKPGNSPGLLTFANSLTLDSTAVTTMEITGANSSGTRGSTYDAVNVADALNYGGTLSLNFDTLFTQVGSYTLNLFDSATTSGSFGSVSLAGVYSGSFTNTSGIWGLTQGDNSWSFNEGDGVLSFNVVPEPNVAMVAGSLALMALLRRRRTA